MVTRAYCYHDEGGEGHYEIPIISAPKTTKKRTFSIKAYYSDQEYPLEEGEEIVAVIPPNRQAGEMVFWVTKVRTVDV